MNENEHITHRELRELEATLRRFDSFKHELTPNPNVLRAALAKLPATLPAPRTRTRRTTRISNIVAAVCASTLAFVLLFQPQTNTLSPLASDMLAEEQRIDASFAYSSGDTTDESLDDADAALALLTDDSVL